MNIGVVGALKAIGTVVSVIGSIQQFQAQKAAAKQQEAIANAQALSMEQQAGQERAASQRAAFQARKEGALVSSRAGAIAAASGAGALDPSIVNIMGGIEQETELRAQTALFEGEESGRGLEHQADIARATGSLRAQEHRAKGQSALFSAGRTLLSGASDIYSKYSPRTGGRVSSPPRTTRTGNPYR